LTLKVKTNKDQEMRVYAKATTGQVWELDLNENDSILKVKQIISEKSEFKVEQQELMYLGRSMDENDKTLKDYNVKS
jgi:predicted secreted protein